VRVSAPTAQGISGDRAPIGIDAIVARLACIIYLAPLPRGPLYSPAIPARHFGLVAEFGVD
jgi:hypothetical protein